MLVLGVNKILKWCQVLSNGRKYTVSDFMRCHKIAHIS